VIRAAIEVVTIVVRMGDAQDFELDRSFAGEHEHMPTTDQLARQSIS